MTRSKLKCNLIVPRTNNRYGERCLQVILFKTWNAITDYIEKQDIILLEGIYNNKLFPKLLIKKVLQELG